MLLPFFQRWGQQGAPLVRDAHPRRTATAISTYVHRGSTPLPSTMNKNDSMLRRLRSGGTRNNGNKYHACPADGYDSRKEARHAALLRLRQQQGDIRDLREQVRYEIIPRQTDAHGRLLERAAYYTADFVYYDRDGNEHVEDVKSAATRRARDFSLRRKLMLYQHGIRIEQV